MPTAVVSQWSIRSISYIMQCSTCNLKDTSRIKIFYSGSMQARGITTGIILKGVRIKIITRIKTMLALSMGGSTVPVTVKLISSIYDFNGHSEVKVHGVKFYKPSMDVTLEPILKDHSNLSIKMSLNRGDISWEGKLPWNVGLSGQE